MWARPRWCVARGSRARAASGCKRSRTISTMTAAVLALGDWLAGLGVTRVVMEATSDYWRAPFYLLEDRFETWLVNAHDVKHLPDRLDAVWLCQVAECQMLRPSFVLPRQIRALRDLTRYRVDLLAVRAASPQEAAVCFRAPG